MSQPPRRHHFIPAEFTVPPAARNAAQRWPLAPRVIALVAEARGLSR